MHELSVAQSIVDIVREYVPPAQVGTVASVRVRVGGLSGIVPESLEFCFAALVADTPLGRARLAIERVPTVCECRDCGRRFEPEALIFFCPSCGGGRAHLVSGSDLQVVDVELEEGQPGAATSDILRQDAGPGSVASNQRREPGRPFDEAQGRPESVEGSAAAGGGGGAPPQSE